MFLEDGKGVWKKYDNLPWNEYLHLERDKFEELLDLMIESHPDHELTEWLKRGFCMNDGDSTISVGSLSLQSPVHRLYPSLSKSSLDIVGS